MKKSDKIIILKAKVIKLKEQLKSARLELADRDNEKSDYDFHKNRNVVGAPTEVEQRFNQQVNNPIESTQELFEGKGYVSIIYDNNKHYFNNNGAFSISKNNLRLFYSINEFFEIFKFIPEKEKVNYLFEPIEKELPTYKVTIDKNDGVESIVFTENTNDNSAAFIQNPIIKQPKEQQDVMCITPPTKENINYDMGG